MPTSTLHDVFELGIRSSASDWHIKENAPISLRIEGKMVNTDFVPDEEVIEEFIELMTSGEMLVEYKDKGDIDLSYVEDGVGRFRANIHRQRGMNAITMRHVKTKIMDFDGLGLPAAIPEIAKSPRGIIIVCGTTGSGKSTTLAAMLEFMNQNMSKHVITIEDPIEYEFIDKQCFFEQREVGLDCKSFYSALIHVLRQDPDVIMVGEMRDRQSFEAALQAADTGHLVMTTLHSTNASQCINRILDFYPRDEQKSIREALALNLRATISQRLLPKAFGGGVAPAVEVMINTPIIHKLLADDRLDKLHSAIEGGRREGMQSFNQSLLDLINTGVVSEEDAMEAATNPEALKMNLQGIFLGTDNKILN